jgi:transcriptional regulator with XRE-family HTH domain
VKRRLIGESPASAIKDIGARIRQIREQRGLKAKDVASAAEITPSLLSQVERGISNASINTLRAIARALDVPIVTFFEDTSRTTEYVVRKDARATLRLAGSLVEYELLSPAGAASVQLFVMKLAPRSVSLDKGMAHAGEETAVVQEGRVELELDDHVVELDVGDSVYIPSDSRHRWRNPYAEPATVIFALSAPLF